MSRCIITGVAGFIGSHLAARLLAEGHAVIGVDCFTDYYPREVKERNLGAVRDATNLTFIERDILDLDWAELLADADYLFHQAAQAGVRASWGDSFEIYTRNNILTTQRLLEAAKDSPLKKFVFASSSSVYGDAESFPTHEEMLPRPISPYGVSKLAAEHLCQLYYKNYDVPVVSLRYFTVYGPRQRPDMGFHKFITAMLHDAEITIYGDGMQTRDFTFVDDVIEANWLAAHSDAEGEVFNIGGGARVELLDVIAMLKEIIGKRIKLQFIERQKGDARDTAADITKARETLGYNPRVSLAEGLRREVAWLKE